MQKWFITGGPLGVLFKIIFLDLYNAQSPELKPWFRETREAQFGAKLEEVWSHFLCPSSSLTHAFTTLPVRFIIHHHDLQLITVRRIFP